MAIPGSVLSNEPRFPEADKPGVGPDEDVIGETDVEGSAAAFLPVVAGKKGRLAHPIKSPMMAPDCNF